MLIGRRKLLSMNNTTICADGSVLDSILLQYIQYLGVTINENLTWEDHVDKICSKVSLPFGRGSRVEGSLSRVEGGMSRVEGTMSRVEKYIKRSNFFIIYIRFCCPRFAVTQRYNHAQQRRFQNRKCGK